MFEVAVRIIRAPAVQTVGNAGCRRPPECHSGFKSIIARQVTILNDVEDLPAVVVPVICGKPFRRRIDHGFQGLPLPAHFKCLLQDLHDGLPIFLLHLPQLHRAGVFPLPGIRYIKDIPQPWPVTSGIDQGDPFRSAPDVSSHGIVPKIIFRTGRRIRALGKDHQLFVIGVFIKPGCSPKERCPLLPAPCDLSCRVLRHLRVELHFICHESPPLSFRQLLKMPVRHMPKLLKKLLCHFSQLCFICLQGLLHFHKRFLKPFSGTVPVKQDKHLFIFCQLHTIFLSSGLRGLSGWSICGGSAFSCSSTEGRFSSASLIRSALPLLIMPSIIP